MTSTGWVREGDKVRCRHARLFDPSLEQCDECLADDPVTADEDDDALPTPPVDCLTSEGHERAFTEIARKLEERGTKLLQNEGRIDAATGKELLVAAIRARHEAVVLVIRREDEALVRARERRILERARGASH